MRNKNPWLLFVLFVGLSAPLSAQVINSISPNNACFNGGSFTLTVNGSGYINSGFGNTSTVRWNGTGLPTTFVSSAQLTATVASTYLDVAGAASITVFNQHLIAPPTTSNAVTFTVNTFAQISNYTTAVCADGTSATINVYSGIDLSSYSVRWNSTTISSSNLGSQPGLGYGRSATVPGSQLTLPGTAQLRLRSPSGCDSDPVTVSMTSTPHISSISPSWRPLGAPTFTLTVNGSNFPSNAVVHWNGLDLPTTFVNSTLLDATIDQSFMARLWTGTISVTGGPCGQADNTMTLDVNGPTMTSVSPTAIGVGASTVTLTVNGSDFTSNTDILFNGTALGTTYVSATQITAAVPGSMLAAAGTQWVSVRNFYLGFPFGTPSQYAYSTSKAFTVQGPTLQRLIPDHIPAGSASFTMTLRGTNLNSTGIPPTLVGWNGTNHIPMYVDSTTLTLTVVSSLIATPGTVSIDVIVPLFVGSRTTNSLTFTIDPPGLSVASTGWTVGGGNADVHDVAVANNTLYIGGDFDHVAPITGGAATLSTVYGGFQQALPAINGAVNVTIPDGSSGWFIGGSFTTVGPFAHAGVAHILSSGVTDPYFNAQVNGPVYDLSISPSGTLFIGGDFSRLDYGPGCNAAAVSATSGETTGFNPAPNGPIAKIAAGGTSYVVITGSFDVVGGVASQVDGLAALSPTTGDLHAWVFNNTAGLSGSQVLRAEGSTMYVASSSTIQARSISDASGLSFGLHSVNGGILGVFTTSALVFIYGDFTMVDGQARGRVAAFDKTNGALQSLNPAANATVRALDEDGGYLYAAGDFTSFAGTPQAGMGSILVSFGTPGYFAPVVLNGTVMSLSVSGSSVAVFGNFNAVGGAARKNLAAIDLTTDSVLPNWQADAQTPVYHLAADANWLYVAGLFSTLDGQPVFRLGRVGLVNGNVDPAWHPSPDNPVTSMLVTPQSLFVSGGFGTIAGAPRPGLAEFDLATGALTPWVVTNAPTSNCSATSMAFHQGRLYMAGYFNTWPEPIRYMRSVDVASATFTNVIPDITGGLCNAIAVDGDTVFLGGDFTAVNGVSVSRLAAVRASDGATLPFNPNVNNDVNAMLKSGATLFIGGVFSQVGGVAHSRIAAVDIGTAQARSWAPVIGGASIFTGVESIRLTSGSLEVGGSIDTVNGTAQRGMAGFALGGPYATPVLSSLGTQSAPTGSSSFVLSLQGGSFTAGSAARFAGVYVPTAFVSANQLQATIDASLLTVAGIMDVVVVAPAPGAGVSASLAFSVENPAPSASALSPSSAPFNGAAFTLSVTGSSFTTQSIVRWNGANLTTTYQSTTQLQAAVTTAQLGTAGAASVTVFNPTPGGGTSGAVTFTVEYPAPGATSLTPPNVPVNSSTFTLTVNGGPFYASSVVRWDGAALQTSLMNGSQLQAQVGAGLLTTAGTHAVDVSTGPPGGGLSGALTFAVLNPAPQCGGLSPSTAMAGDPGFTMQVTGSAFVPTSVVRWNGAGVPTSYVNSALLSATIDATRLAAAGTISVDVQTPGPGGGPSNAQTFTVSNPVPSAGSLSPPSVTAGGPAFALSVTGAGFNAQSVVLADGNPMPTTYGDANHVSVQISGALIASGGSLAISVTNPTPGGGTSGTLALGIQNPVPVLSQLTPPSILAGGVGFTLTLMGSAFVPTSTAQWNGLPLGTTFNSGSQLQAAVPAAFIAFGGSATLSVVNPTPGGGGSNGLLFSIVAPQVLGLSPSSIAPLISGQAPVVVTVNGSGFSPSSIAFANEDALSTFYSSSTQLFATLPSSLPQAQIQGGIAFSVLDGTSHSNGLPLRLGSGLNQGWIMKSPPNPAPGQPFSLVIEGALPSAPVALIVDFANPLPISPFPTASANEVLGLTPNPSALLVLFDGVGVFGPPQGIAFPPTPSGPAPGGRFVLSGLTAFSPPLGISVTLQAAYLAPASPWGLHLTWGHFLMPF